jgi:hypothetical protein
LDISWPKKKNYVSEMAYKISVRAAKGHVPQIGYLMKIPIGMFTLGNR